MPRKQRKKPGVVLPRGVHRVVARGREYFYFQPGRGTAFAGKRIRLPEDPTSPAFWVALQDYREDAGEPVIDTVSVIADRFEASPQFRALANGTQSFYRRGLKIARDAWGNAPIAALDSALIQRVMDEMAEMPGAANNFLGTMRAFSAWGKVRGYVNQSFTESVKAYKGGGGHKPWTRQQIEAAHARLDGMVRRGFMLLLYTGQRGSDMVRMGWTMIDDGGFDLSQVKTGREVWCPILPELADEMAGWEKRPGPFVTQAGGFPYSRKQFWNHFKAAADGIPELAGVTLHGLRATAVIRLRQAGLATAQIQDIVGMSMAMIERYSRFADRKTSGKAAVVSLGNKAKIGNPL